MHIQYILVCITLVIVLYTRTTLLFTNKNIQYIDPQDVEIHHSIPKNNLKEYQSKMTEMFSDFIQVCMDNNLKYVSIGGTLLGALRHDGWIPWDNDIDVAIHEKDAIEIKNIYINNPILHNKYNVSNAGFRSKFHLMKIYLKADGNLLIDIFKLKYLKDNMYSIRKDNSRPVDVNILFPTKNHIFDNLIINIPNKPIELLNIFKVNKDELESDYSKLPSINDRIPHEGMFSKSSCNVM